MRKFLLAALLALGVSPAWAQNPQCPTRPIGDSTNACASTAFVQNQLAAGTATLKVGITPITNGTSTRVLFDNAGILGEYTNTQLTALCQSFTSSLSGCVPASGGGTVNFLRADGSWATPPGTGALLHTHILVGNGSNQSADFGTQITVADVGTLTIAPTAGAASQALVVTQSLTGGSGAAGVIGSVWNVTNTGFNGGAFPSNNAVTINYALNSTSILGGQHGLEVTTTLLAATNAANTVKQYVGLVGSFASSINDGGAGGATKGAGYGLAGGCTLHTGATFYNECTGGEIGIAVEGTGSVNYLAGWTVVTFASHANRGITFDMGYGLGAQAGSQTFKNGFFVGNMNGIFPVGTDGSIFATTAGTVTHGVDFSLLTCSTDCFKSNRFAIDGNGNLTAATGAIGISGSVLGIITQAGSSTGTVTIQPQATAGTPTVTWGTASGTPAVTASSPLAITATTGNITCTTCALTTGTLAQFAATTSAQLAGVISDETGSGVLVFGTTPTFTTSIIDPIVIGGTAAGSSLTLQSTNNGAPSGDQVLFKVGGANTWQIDSNGLAAPGSSALANRILPGLYSGSFVTNTAQIYVSSTNGFTLVAPNVGSVNNFGFFSSSGGELFVNIAGTNNMKFGGGTGTIGFGTGAFAANGSVATVLGSLGPAGAHTTVQKWFTINDGTNTLWIPAF